MFWNFHLLYLHRKFGLFTKMPLLFFSKMSVLLCHPHLHHIFTILSLSSIHQSTMNNQFEALNAPKFRFLLFTSHYLCTQTTSLSLSLYIHQKKSKNLILNFVRFKLMILGHQQVDLFRGVVLCDRRR